MPSHPSAPRRRAWPAPGSRTRDAAVVGDGRRGRDARPLASSLCQALPAVEKTPRLARSDSAAGAGAAAALLLNRVEAPQAHHIPPGTHRADGQGILPERRAPTRANCETTMDARFKFSATEPDARALPGDCQGGFNGCQGLLAVEARSPTNSDGRSSSEQSRVHLFAGSSLARGHRDLGNGRPASRRSSWVPIPRCRGY